MSTRERANTPENGSETIQSQNVASTSYTRNSLSTNSLSSREGQSTASRERHGATNAFQSFRNRFFNTKDKENRRIEQFMTTEGSIKRPVWEGISKENHKDIRLKFVDQLLEVVKHHQLQVSTLEGLYHDLVDLMEDDVARVSVVRLLTEVTATQTSNVGLGLRQEFFKKIREMGCDEQNLKWLRALSVNGEKIDGFERDMDFMLAEWVKNHLLEQNLALKLGLLDLTIQLIKRNSAYICAAALSDVLKCVCILGCKLPVHYNPAVLDPEYASLTEKCLELIDTVLKFSDVPRDLVLFIIPVICIQVCSVHFRDKSWLLSKLLFASQMGHRTRKSIQALLEDSYPLDLGFSDEVYNLLIRGAIFCLANAIWGYHKIENMTCSPANVLPSFTKVICKSPEICIDVFTATKRLLNKYGAELHPLVWLRLLELFSEALAHFQRSPEFNSRCSPLLKAQLALTEQFHQENQFSASTETLFEFIERAVDFYPDCPANSLIDYKFSRITPQTPNFIEAASAVVRRYAHPKQHQERRKKAVQCMSSFFIRYRMLYESELAERLVLPVVSNITREKNAAVQYQLILALFDIARHVSFRGPIDLFSSAMQLVRRLMNMAINNSTLPSFDEATEESSSDRDTLNEYDGSGEELTLTLDNLECIAKNMEEVLSERWGQFSLKNLSIMLSKSLRLIQKRETDILIEHLHAQYAAGWIKDMGASIRESIVTTLLSLQRIASERVTRTDPEPRTNLLIKRKYDDNENGFVWSDICKVATDVFIFDRDWSVIRACLERLGKVLENMSFVRTADRKLVNNLCVALVELHNRAERREIEFPKQPDRKEDEGAQSMEFPTEETLSKYLPPVLAILLNYTSLYHSEDNRNNEICRVLVDCVNSEHLEGLMAIDVAVQLVPDAMGSNAFKLLDILKRLEPSSKKAIPLIEFMSDSAEIAEFHRFFNEEHYRTVVDILVPYADVNKFNAYIVSCIHRILMRWYVKIPQTGVGMNNARWNISKYIGEKFTSFPIMWYSEPMKRQYSGDGRTVENPFLLGGDPSTPPPESRTHPCLPRGQDRMNEEILKAMQNFFLIGKIDPDMNGPAAQMQQAPPDKYEEVLVEHYFLNDTIISVRQLVDRKWKQSVEETEDEVFNGDGDAGSPSSPNEFTPSSFDQRKRYASAKHPPRSASVKPVTKALDDLYALGGPHQQTVKSNIKRPVLAFVQLTTRHMYGKSSYLMRALDEWPDDFEKSSAQSSSSHAFMHHIINVPGGLQPLAVSRNENEQKDLDRALRVLDNLPGIEHHVVGVLYMAPGQETESEVLANIYGSERYNSFLKLLGDVVTLKSCPGGLRESIHGQYTYAYTDPTSTIIYQIASLMPTDPSDGPQNVKKLLIGNNHVSIVFNESGRPFKTGLIAGQFDSVTLEIVPSDPRTVVITVHAKTDIACWLAMKRVLLTDEAASRLIRKLIVRSYLSVRVFHSLSKSISGSPYISSGIERLRKIYAIRDKYVSGSASI